MERKGENRRKIKEKIKIKGNILKVPNKAGEEPKHLIYFEQRRF